MRYMEASVAENAVNRELKEIHHIVEAVKRNREKKRADEERRKAERAEEENRRLQERLKQYEMEYGKI